MKKLLLATAAIAALSSSAFAAESDTYYLKANAGAVMLNKSTDVRSGLKMKSNTSANLGFGVGYYLMDNVRADLELSFLVSPQMKKTGNTSGYVATGYGAPDTRSVSVKHKGNVVALLVNAYVDMFDVSVAKVFAGAGVGMAQVKEKISYKDNSVAPAGAIVPPAAGAYYNDTLSGSSKKKTNFAYQVTLGASSEVAPGVNAELSYSWKDYGKTKTKKDQDWAGTTRYKGHHINAGVRFDL